MSAIQRGRNINRFAPTQSLGTLTYVNLNYVLQHKSLQHLQQLSNFCQRMKINPLWYQKQSIENKLKFLKIYQYSLNYSKNLKKTYDQAQEKQKSQNQILKRQIKQKKNQIKTHKKHVQTIKDQYRQLKILRIKKVQRNHQEKLQKILKEQEQLNFKNLKLQQQINARYQKMMIHDPNSPYYYPAYYGHPPVNYNSNQDSNFQPYPPPINQNYVQIPSKINSIPHSNKNSKENSQKQIPQSSKNIMNFLQSAVQKSSQNIQSQKQIKNQIKYIQQKNPNSILSFQNVAQNSENQIKQPKSSIQYIDQFNLGQPQHKNSERLFDQFTQQQKKSKVQAKSMRLSLDNKQKLFQISQKQEDIDSSPTFKVNVNKQMNKEKSTTLFSSDQFASTNSRLGKNSRLLNKRSIVSSINNDQSSYIATDQSFFNKKLNLESKIQIKTLNQSNKEKVKDQNDKKQNNQKAKVNQNEKITDKNQKADRNALLNSRKGYQFDDSQFDKLLQGQDLHLSVTSTIYSKKQNKQQNLNHVNNNNIKNPLKTSQSTYKIFNENKNIKIEQVAEEQELQSGKGNSQINRNSSIVPPVLKKEKQQQYPQDYQDDYQIQDIDDQDLGLNNKKEKSNLKNIQKTMINKNKNNKNNLTVQTKRSIQLDGSNIQIDLSPNNSYIDIQIPKKYPYAQLINDKFQLKQQLKKQYQMQNNDLNVLMSNKTNQLSSFHSLNLMQSNVNRNNNNNNNFKFNNICKENNQNQNQDIFDDLMDMPMNSKIGQTKKNVKNSLNQSINVRVISDQGKLIQSSKQSKQSGKLNQSNSLNLSSSSNENFLTFSDNNLISKIQPKNHITQSITINNNDNLTKNLNNSGTDSINNIIRNNNESLRMPLIKSVFQTKKIVNQPQRIVQEQVQQQITLNLLDSKAQQYQKQQIQQQIVKIIRNKQKPIIKNSSKNNEQHKKITAQIYKKIQKDISKQINEMTKQKSIKQNDWNLIQKYFTDQIQKIKKNNQNISKQIVEKICKIQQHSKEIQYKHKNNQVKQNDQKNVRQKQLTESQQIDLNYSTSMNQNFYKKSSIKKISKTGNQNIQKIQRQDKPKAQQSIKILQKSISESNDLFDLPEVSKINTNNTNIPLRANNLINPTSLGNIQLTSQKQVSKSKYAVKRSPVNQQSSKSISKQSIVSKLKQNKYNNQDPLINDINKATNLFKKQNKKLDEEQDDDF